MSIGLCFTWKNENQWERFIDNIPSWLSDGQTFVIRGDGWVRHIIWYCRLVYGVFVLDVLLKYDRFKLLGFIDWGGLNRLRRVSMWAGCLTRFEKLHCRTKSDQITCWTCPKNLIVQPWLDVIVLEETFFVLLSSLFLFAFNQYCKISRSPWILDLPETTVLNYYTTNPSPLASVLSDESGWEEVFFN